MEPWKYRYIAAWHRQSGSQQYYIDAMQAKAAKEGAPLDALYARYPEPGWVCVSDLAAHQRFGLIAVLKRAVEAADLVEREKSYDR